MACLTAYAPPASMFGGSEPRCPPAPARAPRPRAQNLSLRIGYFISNDAERKKKKEEGLRARIVAMFIAGVPENTRPKHSRYQYFYFLRSSR